MNKYWEYGGLQVVPYRHGFVVQHVESGVPFGGVPYFLFEDAVRRAQRLLATKIDWTASLETLEAAELVYYNFGSIWEGKDNDY